MISWISLKKDRYRSPVGIGFKISQTMNNYWVVQIQKYLGLSESESKLILIDGILLAGS